MKERIFGLDVLRASAICFVVFAHLPYLLDSKNSLFVSFSGLFGFFGVEVFFVLSGFLIGTILLKLFMSDNFTAKSVLNFFRRRFMRTLPNYYLALVLNICVALFIGYSVDNWWQYFFFLQNFSTYSISFFPESWSLTIEEWSYVFLPLFLIIIYNLVKSYRKASFFIVVIILILFFHILRYFHYLENFTPTMTVWNTDIKAIAIYRIDSILVGFVVAWTYHFYKEILQKFRFYTFILFGFLFVFQFVIMNVIGISIEKNQLYFTVFYFSLVSFGIALAMPIFIFWTKSLKVIGKPIVFISKISYSIYLLHYGILMVILKYFQSNFQYRISNLALLFIYFSLLLFSSYLLYRYFEKPIMDKR